MDHVPMSNCNLLRNDSNSNSDSLFLHWIAIYSSDLLFVIFDFLDLLDLSRVWRCCSALSQSHWHYRFQDYHVVQVQALVSCLKQLRFVYTRYLVKTAFAATGALLYSLCASLPLLGQVFTNSMGAVAADTHKGRSRLSMRKRAWVHSYVRSLRISCLYISAEHTSSYLQLPALYDAFDDIAHVKFSSRDNLTVLPCLPANVQCLDLSLPFCSTFTPQTLSQLPQSVTSLSLFLLACRLSDDIRLDHWPQHLKRFSLSSNRGQSVVSMLVELPCSELTELSLFCDLCNFKYSPKFLPKLQSLVFHRCGRNDLPALPVNHFSGFTMLRTLALCQKIEALEPHVLPRCITSLTLPPTYCFPLQPHVLPPELLHLDLGTQYNHPLHAGVLPITLQSLVLSTLFNSELSGGSLPPSLLKLTINRDYSYPLTPGILPSSLVDLECRQVMHYPITAHVFPDGLRRLVLLRRSCHIFSPNNELPANLVELIMHFGQFTRQVKTGLLPKSLRKLEFSDDWSGSPPVKDGQLPEELLELKITGDQIVPIRVGSLPKSLRTLDVMCVNKRGPHPFDITALERAENLERLLLRGHLDMPLDRLPNQLLELHLPVRYNIELHTLPSSLTSLTIGMNLQTKRYRPRLGWLLVKRFPPQMQLVNIHIDGSSEEEQKCGAVQERLALTKQIQSDCPDCTFRVFHMWPRELLLV